ncbi:class I SAM-dependent methyltransferase, partial [Escherichia coli]
DKSDERAIFSDIRKEGYTLRNGRRLIISPDIIADFRALSFADASFSMVVLDPPHLESVGDNAWMGKKYGRLNKDAWRDDSRQRFKEAFRVLRPHGVLIF